MKTKNQIQKMNEATIESFKTVKISTENLLLFLNLNMLEKYCKQTFDLYATAMGIKKWSLFILLIAFSFGASGQDNKINKNTNKSSITVLNINTKALNLDPNQMGNKIGREHV